MDLRQNVDWWSENRSKEEAERWYTSILERIYSLEKMPGRCPMAREVTKIDEVLHNLWFGLSSKQTHRILFTINGTTVNILRILSARQDTTDLNLGSELP